MKVSWGALACQPLACGYVAGAGGTLGCCGGWSPLSTVGQRRPTHCCSFHRLHANRRSSSFMTTCSTPAATTAACTRRWPPLSCSPRSTASTAPSSPVRARRMPCPLPSARMPCCICVCRRALPGRQRAPAALRSCRAASRRRPCCRCTHGRPPIAHAPPTPAPADGVTSSGKTHTMMGSDDEPGMVPHAIAEVFRQIARTPGKEFLLRLSMMEIYNEVGAGGASIWLGVRGLLQGPSEGVARVWGWLRAAPGDGGDPHRGFGGCWCWCCPSVRRLEACAAAAAGWQRPGCGPVPGYTRWIARGAGLALTGPSSPRHPTAGAQRPGGRSALQAAL